MAELGSIFEYNQLEDPSNDIRLITLLPGQTHDVLRLKIRHVKLPEGSQIPKTDAHQLHQLEKELEPPWIVTEALDGRFLYVHTDSDGGKTTSWTFPESNHARGVEKYRFTKSSEGFSLRYEALSYVWGAEEDPLELLIRMTASPEDEDVGEVLIEIPGTQNPPQYQRLHVRRTLEVCLRHLRYTNRKRILWIDAIYINQADITERSEQVSRIKDVYRSTERVIMWIGPSTGESQLALQMLNYIGRQVVCSKARTHLPAPNATEPSWFHSSTVLPYDDKVWDAIKDLLTHSWFKRLWVVQEAHLAQTGVFLCGHDEMDWIILRYAILTLWYNKPSATT